MVRRPVHRDCQIRGQRRHGSGGIPIWPSVNRDVQPEPAWRTRGIGWPQWAWQPHISLRAESAPGRRRSRLWLWAGAAGLAVVVVLAAVGYIVLGGSGPAHALVTPDKIGAYVRRPQLEQQMNARDLQAQVTARSGGEVSHVVYAVYEDSTGGSGSSGPVLFIGGNLSGVSPTSFIASFTNEFKGAQSTSAGSMGGRAACVSAEANAAGSVALCIWADSDTFGVFASPTMGTGQLAALMRSIRPHVERPAK